MLLTLSVAFMLAPLNASFCAEDPKSRSTVLWSGLKPVCAAYSSRNERAFVAGETIAAGGNGHSGLDRVTPNLHRAFAEVS